MKRTVAIAVLLFGFCATIFAPVISSVPTPQDDPTVRSALQDRPELKSLTAEKRTIILTRLWQLKLDRISKVFGPKLETSTSHFLPKYPTNLVLPSFSALIDVVSSGHSSNPAENKSHTDLHAVSDIGYIVFYYQLNGENIQDATIFFRADDKFVPLKSTNDLPKRLEWDKAKFEALKKWLDEYLPVVPYHSQDDPKLTSAHGVTPWQWLFTVQVRKSQTNNQSRLWPRQEAEVANIFGPQLATAAHPGLLKYPADLVVPGVGSGVMPVYDLHLTDLHAVGDIGYIQFFYHNAGGDDGLQPPALYFRTDDKFVPLRSTNDLPKRLEWEKAKFEALNKWLDEHLPGK